MADWSQLPNELLQQISQKLNYSDLYLLRFRSVCSSWRRSIFLPNCHHHLRPWLIRIGPDVYGKPQIWHPFDVYLQYPLFFAPCHFVHHLIDFNQLPIIDIGHMFYIYGPGFHFGKVVVATCEMGQPLALLTYDMSDVPKIFQREENSWMNIPTMPRSLWGDICLFKGRPCVADKDGRTLMIGQEDSSAILLANPVFGFHVKFLVESECELLLVDCDGIDMGADDKDMKFDVFRLDEKEKKWIKLTTLDQGRVSRLSDNPDYIKLFWPPPKWILGLHNQNEFDVSEVIENDNDGSYDDEADIGSAVDDDEGSNDCGVDIGSDDAVLLNSGSRKIEDCQKPI
ncbi:hypothetical protein P8452_24708 [Trifolium repens]|nr:hypothetical protein P8452_24708 [Trifolium repens]